MVTMCMYDLYLGASPLQEIPTRYHSYPAARVSLRLNFDRYCLLLLTLPPSLPPTRLVVATAAVCRYRGDSLCLSGWRSRGSFDNEVWYVCTLPITEKQVNCRHLIWFPL